MCGGFLLQISLFDKKKVDGQPSTRGCSAMLDPFFDSFFCFFVQDGRISSLGGGFKYFLFSPQTLRK